jgi:hypothetical protein
VRWRRGPPAYLHLQQWPLLQGQMALDYTLSPSRHCRCCCCCCCCQLYRGLAQCALAQGDACQALHHYGELVSKALMGRGSAEHWAYAEYGWLLFQVGALTGCIYDSVCTCMCDLL